MKFIPPVWRDGKIVPWSETKVHVFSHALSRGTAVFEVLTAERTDSGTALFRASDHIARMRRSATQIGMKLTYGKPALIEAMKKVVVSSKLSPAIVKVVALWPGIEFEVIPRNRDVSMIMTAFPYPEDMGPKRSKGSRNSEKGLKACIVKTRKLDPDSVPVTSKVAANYLNPMLAKMEAKKRRADIPVLLDKNGYIAEGATESVFIVKKGILYTPAEGNILPGITRDTVIKLAGDIGVEVREKKLKPNAFDGAEEVFFTASPDWLLHASSMNGKIVGDGKKGDVTKSLLDRFEQVVRGRVARRRGWLVPIK